MRIELICALVRGRTDSSYEQFEISLARDDPATIATWQRLDKIMSMERARRRYLQSDRTVVC